MMDYLNIGSSPPAEDCAAVGSENYLEQARKECKVYIDLLRRTLGEGPPGARLKVKSFPHDFGTYMEVVCYFEDDNEEALNYALVCEGEGPEYWDAEALKGLKN